MNQTPTPSRLECQVLITREANEGEAHGRCPGTPQAEIECELRFLRSTGFKFDPNIWTLAQFHIKIQSSDLKKLKSMSSRWVQAPELATVPQPTLWVKEVFGAEETEALFLA